MPTTTPADLKSRVSRIMAAALPFILALPLGISACTALGPVADGSEDLSGKYIGHADWRASPPSALDLAIAQPLDALVIERNHGRQNRLQERVVLADGGFLFHELVRPEIYSPQQINYILRAVLREDGLIFDAAPSATQLSAGNWQIYALEGRRDGETCFGFIVFTGNISYLDIPGNQSVRGGSCATRTEPSALRQIWLGRIATMNLQGKNTGLRLAGSTVASTLAAQLPGMGRQLQTQPEPITRRKPRSL